MGAEREYARSALMWRSACDQFGERGMQRPAGTQQFDRIEVRGQQAKVEFDRVRRQCGQVARDVSGQRRRIGGIQCSFPGMPVRGKFERECARAVQRCSGDRGRGHLCSLAVSYGGVDGL